MIKFFKKIAPYKLYDNIILNLPLERGSYTVIDTELTGLDYKRDSIVSIGGIKMKGLRIEIGETFYRLINPETLLTSKGVLIHGITPSDVEARPPINEVIVEFMDFCKDSVIVGHFLSIDLRFLNKELKKISHEPLRNPAIDTCKINDWINNHSADFSRHFREDSKKDLFSIAKSYNIEITESHNALMDAFITAQIFQRFLVYLLRMGVKTIRELVHIGKP